MSRKRNRDPKTNKRVLSDHKQEGKNFIPPMGQLNMNPVSWMSDIMPEFLWIALILRGRGLLEGVHIVEGIVNGLKKVSEFEEKKYSFAFMSAFLNLEKSETRTIISALSPRLLQITRTAFAPLLVHYPGSPFAFFNTSKETPQSVDLKPFKELLADFSNRREIFAMHVQATALHVNMMTGRMVVHRDSGLTEIDKIRDYPDTEVSRKVASLVRANVNGLMGIFPESHSDWPQRFWNRGLELEKCYVFNQK